MPGQGTELLEPTVAGALRRYWWLVLALTLIGGLAGAGYSLLQHKQYTSQASLAIPPPTSQQLLGSSATGTTTEYIAGQVATLKSPQVANIAAQIAQRKLHKAPNAATITQDAVITPPVTAGNGSSASTAATATIGYTARKPQVAATTANAIVTAYGEVRADQLKSQAQAAESKLTDSLTSINQQLSGITTQINVLQAQQNQSTAAQQQTLLNEGVKSGHTTATENANLQALLAQQSALDKQQADLVAHQNDIESNLQQALAQQLNVVPALPSKSPSSPKTLRNVGLGLLVLALVGVLASYIVALRRRRFAGRHEPENLYQAPLLGDVPRLQAENITSALPVVTNPISAAAESFRFLAASLGTVQPAHEHLPVIVTSATSGSGKTTMSANVATALAARGWRVLAVDADFIRRGLSTLLLETDGMQGPGLSEVLSGEVNVETAARPATIEQGTLSGELSVLTPGASGDLLPSLVASSGSEEFRTKICMPYDAVIVDGPPLAGVAFAADLASLVGNIIVVVNHDDLVGPQMDFVDQLHATSGQIIGYIYNRAPLRKGLASYYQYQYQSAGGPGHAAQSPNQARRPAPAIPASVSTAARVADPTASDVATSEDEEVARWAVTPSAIAEPANPRTAGGSDRTESSRDVRAPG